MITVYYDGLCGLCAKEIRYYQRIAPAQTFHWVDVNQDMRALEAANVSLVDALKSLHVKTSDGLMHQGVDSFIVIWRQLRGWRYLAWLVNITPIKALAKIAYRRFAEKRFAKLSHCSLAAQSQTNPPQTSQPNAVRSQTAIAKTIAHSNTAKQPQQLRKPSQ